MIYGFYFRFFKKTQNRFLSCLFAKLARIIYLLRFLIKKLKLKKQTVLMSVGEAHKIVESVHPDPGIEPEYKNCKIDENLDLSIVVPVYNYAELIGKNIESVLNQKTKYKYQLVLVDDGSTDGARDVLLSYKDNPNVKIVFQENQGIAGARNTGIENAVGKYLMFLDCDDEIHDDMVETLLDKAYEKDCDIVMCAHNLVKEKDGNVIDVIPNVYPDKDLMKYGNEAKILNFAGLPWCKVYKREMFDDVRYFPKYWYEDTIIQWLIFSKSKNFVYIPKIEYEYRWYEKNFSHTQNNRKNPKTIDSYWLLIAILEQYEKIGLPYDKKFYIMLLTHLSVYYYPAFANLDSEVIEAMFILANELLEKYKPEKPYKLPYMLKVVEESILTKDIELWKLASKNV